MNSFTSIHVDNFSVFKQKLVHWANSFPIFSFLDSNNHKENYHKYDFICAIDILDTFEFTKDFQPKLDNFYFGHLTFDIYCKDDNTKSNSNFIEFEKSFLYLPRYIIYGLENRVYFNRNLIEAMEIKDHIDNINLKTYHIPNINFIPRINQYDYSKKVLSIQNKIQEGDFYELNFCIELIAENIELSPIETFQIINSTTKAPMSALVKYRDKYILSFSPERFMAKRGNVLIAQPIKGTARRNLLNADLDDDLKTQLENSEKERAENSMIVDLMRHDLTFYAIPGTVLVREYCKVYSFQTVHQMISTVSAELQDENEAIKALFKALPAASMTGAPKKIVVETILELENFSRGIYAGHIGYIDNQGDFDFNVVIRTLEFDSLAKKASIHVGSAITLLSNPKDEYDECLLKAQGILKFFKEDPSY